MNDEELTAAYINDLVAKRQEERRQTASYRDLANAIVDVSYGDFDARVRIVDDTGRVHLVDTIEYAEDGVIEIRLRLA